MGVKLHLVVAVLLFAAPLRAGVAPATQAPISELRFAALWPDLAPAQTPHPSVVRVIAPEGLAMSMGSGTLVDRNEQFGLVVTNWHVVRDARGPVEVVFPGGFRSKATVVRTDRDWDLAALLIARPPVEPVPLSTVVPKPGDALRIAGYGSGKYRMQSGRCTQYLSPGRNKPFEMIELSAVARQGDSGGPILNERGELAGVLFGANSSGTSGSYGGRVDQFLRLASNDLRRIPALNVAQRAAPQSATDAGRVLLMELPPPPSDDLAASDIQPSATGDPTRRMAAFAGQVLRPGEAAAIDSPRLEAPSPRIAREAISGGETIGPARLPVIEPAPMAQTGGEPTHHEPPGIWFIWGDELKTILAAFGVAAILLHVLRWIAAAKN